MMFTLVLFHFLKFDDLGVEASFLAFELNDVHFPAHLLTSLISFTLGHALCLGNLNHAHRQIFFKRQRDRRPCLFPSSSQSSR